MLCADLTTIWAFATSTTTTKSSFLSLRMSSPVAGECGPAQMVVMTSGEFASRTANPWNLDLVEAGPIISAVLIVWAAGWGIRQLIRAARHTDNTGGASDL